MNASEHEHYEYLFALTSQSVSWNSLFKLHAEVPTGARAALLLFCDWVNTTFIEPLVFPFKLNFVQPNGEIHSLAEGHSTASRCTS